MNRICSIIICLIAVVAFTLSVFAHPGRTDANGGHYDHSTGEYHYHNGSSAGKSSSGSASTKSYDYDDDYSKGYSAGYTEGDKCGYVDGYQGLAVDSNNYSYDSTCYSIPSNESTGYKQGYATGYKAGYDHGYNEGQEYYNDTNVSSSESNNKDHQDDDYSSDNTVQSDELLISSEKENEIEISERENKIRMYNYFLASLIFAGIGFALLLWYILGLSDELKIVLGISIAALETAPGILLCWLFSSTCIPYIFYFIFVSAINASFYTSKVLGQEDEDEYNHLLISSFLNLFISLIVLFVCYNFDLELKTKIIIVFFATVCWELIIPLAYAISGFIILINKVFKKTRFITSDKRKILNEIFSIAEVKPKTNMYDSLVQTERFMRKTLDDLQLAQIPRKELEEEFYKKTIELGREYDKRREDLEAEYEEYKAELRKLCEKYRDKKFSEISKCQREVDTYQKESEATYDELLKAYEELSEKHKELLAAYNKLYDEYIDPLNK